ELVTQGFKRGENRRRIQKLIGTSQCGICQGVAALRPTPVIPLPAIARIVEVVTKAPKVGAHSCGVLDQACRRLGVSANGGTPRAEDVSFFKTNLLARGSQKITVVNIDAG